ncbi:MAG TPA: cyclase family protein [Gammaproteobacteria bacterium]
MVHVMAAWAAFLILALGSAPARAQSWQPPADAERCPSPWGADDERGAANRMLPDVVLRAARLIRAGEVIEMGYPLHPDMPFYGDRVYSQQIKRTRWSTTANPRGSNEEIITTELGQVGTQIDGFGHQTIGDSHYNCFKLDEIVTRTGFSKLGMENSGGFFTRGVLLDIAALKGVDMLGDQYEITAQDLRDALARQDLELETGDAVIINTGFWRLWGTDNVRYYRTQPGLGVEAAEWLAAQQPMIVGADSCCVEVNPNPDPNLSSPVHQILLVAHGIYLLESLKVDELIEKNIDEFAFIVQPLKLTGATGSSVAPMAVH